jgi:hypothetical protein
MSILIVPYDGESAELTKALKRYNCAPKKAACKGGSCPIPKPLRMMTSEEVKTSIANTLKTVGNVKQVAVLALNEKDQLSFVEMSRAGDWGSMKKGVTVKIIC